MEEWDMAALVRHDTAVKPVFPGVDTEIRADAAEIARLYDALDCLSARTRELPACLRAVEARSRKK
jgi:hypothetical protein